MKSIPETWWQTFVQTYTLTGDIDVAIEASFEQEVPELPAVRSDTVIGCTLHIAAAKAAATNEVAVMVRGPRGVLRAATYVLPTRRKP